MSEESGEKKIIVDEDWKAQAQAEKEALQKQAEAEKAQQSEAGQAEAGPSAAEGAEAAAGARSPLPPADFLTHVVSLATQTMMLLGAMPDPMTGKQEVDLEQAKHLIDTLAVLQEKTKGNLTDQESTTLENLLHELRMGYVSVQKASKTAGGEEAES